MMFRHESVRKLYPNVITTVDDKSYDSSGNLVNVDEDLVLKENAKLEAEFDALAYSRARQAEYPDWGTQLEKIADDGIDAWKADMLEPVKAKFPKP